MERDKLRWMKGPKGAPFAGLGPLEVDILTLVWERDQATVRDIYETLREQRQIAYTTVMTVMGNLVKKGLLAQDRSNITYRYSAAIPGDEVACEILDRVVAHLCGGRPNLAVSHLLGFRRDLSREQVEELRSYARERFET